MSEDDRDLRSIQQARRLAERAATAARHLATFSQERLDAILDAMQAAALPRAEEWARLAVEETGFGNVGDKILKNLFSTVDLHRHIRPMRTVGVLREDEGSRLTEIASPVGVVAAIVPSTNPTSTAIYKIFIALKAGNAVVVSPHPFAQRCVGAVVETLAAAAEAAGAPTDAIACMTEPHLDGTTELMKHPAVGVILATGGTGLVRAAYSSGKPAFGVGPGNVPAFVEQTADVAKAARDIVSGKTFDNGVLCSSENAVVADAPIAAQLISEMKKQGAHFCDEDQAARLARLAVRQDGSLNTAIVGKPAAAIAAMAGLSTGPSEPRCLVAHLTGVGRDHPLSREKLSPILAFYTEDGWEACCLRVLEILNYGGMGHTMSIHSRDRDIIMKFALTKPVFRICVNTPASVGAVGLTTGLEPSMTLGCGALGGNITSDNIMPRHLINLKRLAFETRTFEEATAGAGQAVTGAGQAVTGASQTVTDAGQAVAAASSSAPLPSQRPGGAVRPAGRPAAAPGSGSSSSSPAGSSQSNGHDDLRGRVARVVASLPPARAAAVPPPAPAPRAGSVAASERMRERAGERTGGGSRDKPEGRGAAVPFVSEADVRQALDEKRCIPIDARTIITPSARDLGQEHRVFQHV